MSDKILPCPFCHSDSVIVHGMLDNSFVRCLECRAGGPFTNKDDAQAVAAWNAALRQVDPERTQGIYGKYLIAKADGTPVDPDAQYFVLRLDTDLHARRAIMAYAESVEIENGTLSSELRTWAVGLEQAAGETPQGRNIIIAGYPNQMPPTVHVVYTQRCEVCKHWERTFGLDGICHNDDVINKLSPLSTEGAMQTDENFGCIFWQRKPGDNE